MLRRGVTILLAGWLAGTSGTAFGESAISCHCFKDRSFNPAEPAAADPYVLATTQNSLLSQVYGVAKKSIVRAKMTGTSGQALWVAHEVAKRTDKHADELLDARDRGGSWQAALDQVGVPVSRLGSALVRSLRGPDPDAALTAIVVDGVLRDRLQADPESLARLRQAGTSPAERIAAIVLHRLQRGEPEKVLEQVRSGAGSWGAQFHAAGVEPQDIEEALQKLLR